MWLVLNFSGIICLFLSNVILFINASFLYKIGACYGVPILAMVCLARVSFSTPGCVRTRIVLDNPTDEQKKLIKEYTRHGIVQPSHSHWSVALRQVVIDYDHYCTWCNNGIGLLNIRYFIQFVFWTFVSCLYTLVCIFYHIVRCHLGYGHSCGWLFYNQVLISPQLAMGFIFGIFTGSMLYTQLNNLKDGLTSVDRAKGVTVGREWSFHRFFGSYNVLGWFFPTNNSAVLLEHGKKTVSECALKLSDAGINTTY